MFKIGLGRSPSFVHAALGFMLLILAAPIHAADIPVANGVFLVAKPGMADPNFRDTVVLITEPEVGGGPIGVIVNRPLNARLSEAVPDLGDVPEQFDKIYSGGPVARNMMLLLVRTPQAPERSLQVLADVYLTGDRELLGKIVRGETTVTALRAYVGYSGWAPDQLQAEIAREGWYVIKADADMIFAEDPSTVWKTLMRRIKAVVAAK
jgi:putative transcriptional regulator